jgi:beta-galactosidase
MSELEFRDGVAHWDGKPGFLVTADYPYYRDDPKLWRPKVERLASLGVKAVTAYIPWRHHELEFGRERRLDFTGETRANRNVIGFIAICRELGLPLILKPGPFCHAELNYGGLPDFVCPLFRRDIEPRLSADQTPATWNGAALNRNGTLGHWPLPSAFSTVYLVEAGKWLEAVAREVLLRACAPEGPVVAVQIGNEGLFSDAQHAVWAHDFSVPALDAFRTWLLARHQNLESYNASRGTGWRSWADVQPPREWTSPTSLRALDRYREWAEFLGDTTSNLLRGHADHLSVSVPVLVNVNPPRAEPWGMDAWLSRVRPGSWHGLQFGFTNWIGVAADDRTVVDRYAVMAAWHRGPNLEENWGFTEYYGDAYAHPVVSFHQSLAMVGSGATGYNLYTGVATADWDDSLDALHARPYPSSAPIDAVGNPTPKAGVAALLGRFLDKFGAELMECSSSSLVAWGVNPADSYLGAWIAGAESPAVEGHILTAPGPILKSVQELLSELGHSLALVDLAASDDGKLESHPLLLVAGLPIMAADIQERLSRFVSAGCRLIVIGELPHLDSELQPCSVLEQAQPTRVKDVLALGALLPDVVGESSGVSINRGGRAWTLCHPKRDVEYLVALSSGPTELEVAYSSGKARRHVSLRMAGGGGAIVRLEGGWPTAFLIKGIDERFERSVAPVCSIDGFELAAEVECDLFAVRSDNGWCVCGPAPAEEAAAGVYLASQTRFRVRESH